MRSVIEIPGIALKNVDVRELDGNFNKKLDQKLRNKILIRVLILSSFIFCIVIILRFGGFLKLDVSLPTLENTLYNHGNDCQYFHRQIYSTATTKVGAKFAPSKICPRNK